MSRKGPTAPAAGARPAPAPGAAPDAEPRIAVLLVTHESATELPAWFEAVAALEHRPLEVVVVDCASRDGSAAAAERLGAASGLASTVLALADNRGFAGGMNAALAATDAPYALALNPDARPAPDFAGRLLAALEARPQAGAATGRLLRFAEPQQAWEARSRAQEGPPAAPPAGLRPSEPLQHLDACGMRLTWTWRHLDRGSGEPDRGQYTVAERVFGATGAACLLRRAALDDTAVDGEIFDPRFHSFREDAELAFRLAERGWWVLYEPTAVAHHRRGNLPSRRSQMPPVVNYHSLKNRYLLRLYHQTPLNAVLTLVPTLLRDLAAFAWVVTRERSSLAAYGWLWRHRRELLARRRLIQRRRTAPGWAIDRWFLRRGEPLGEVAPR